MGEQQCPYWEEFDGNDYTASHLMLYVDGEPAGVDARALVPVFAKLERCVILRRYRCDRPVHPIIEWCKEFARKKGYPRAYLHGQQRLWKILEKEGFRQVNDKPFQFLRSRIRRLRLRSRAGRGRRTLTPIRWC